MPLHGRENKCRTELCDILHRYCLRNIQAESKRLNIFVKSRVFPAFLLFIECWGYPPQTRTQSTFREKSFGISKAFAKIKWCVRWEILWLTFLIRKVSWGCPPQTRTQRTFREKYFGISKASRQNKVAYSVRKFFCLLFFQEK